MAQVNLVWFKKDLRVLDHRPLALACQTGQVIAVYVYEPEILGGAEFDPSHWKFLDDSLRQLDRALAKLGSGLLLLHGEAAQALEMLHHRLPFSHIYSHEETGNMLSYKRDLRVKKFAAAAGIEWLEFPQTGVVRRLASRDLWAANFERRMREAVVEAPQTLVSPEALRCEPGFRCLPDHSELGVAANTKIISPGGESFALDTLQSFLYERGREYRSHMSSPVTADSSSRLSPYLAFGNISIKQTVQAANLRQKELSQESQPDRLWLDSIKSFQSRLRWHCHFMQKLEDEPAIEFRNMSSVYDGIRDEFDQELFQAWCHGMTGYPMVDACMRALKATGWINFRMRAMLVSFASYHLWLHWRPTAVYLARHFLDFEPGIHFSQIQMQSGTTGINTIRIYSPAKQALDQDPQGVFIKQWVPELSGLPAEYLAEPEKTPPLIQMASGCIIGEHYPAPVVEHKAAYKRARDTMFALANSSAARLEAARVYEKHGSRKRPANERFWED